jgi:RNA polymerase sigma-70 factor (ECF subfamily)
MDNLSISDAPSDEELAAQAQAGLRAPFEELVRRYSRRLYLFLRPRVGSDPDTEDLVQDTFLKAFSNIGRYDDTYRFSTWIYTMASRLVIGYYRRNRRPTWSVFPPSGVPDPLDALVREEDSRNLWTTAEGLGPDQFQALWLRYMEDMALKEIAAVLKKSQVHIRVLLHRARTQLSIRLNPSASSENQRPAGRAGTALLYSKKEGVG